MAVVLNDIEDIKNDEQKDIKNKEISRSKSRRLKRHKRHNTHIQFIMNTKFENKIDSNGWCGLFRGYIRQDYFEDELRASWGELFYDLIFVACIVHLALQGVHSLPTNESENLISSSSETTNNHSSDCGTYDYLILVFAQFGLFSAFWLEQVMYITHFLFNQCMDEFLRVMYMAMILSMGIFVQNDPSYHKAFIISYAVLRFFSLFMYLKAYLIPRAKCHALWHLSLYFTIFILLLIVYVCMDMQWIYDTCSKTYLLLYFAFFLLEYVGRSVRLILPKNVLPENMRISMNIPHIAERYGLFVMIILGESLISTVTAALGELDLNKGFAMSFDDVPSVPSDIMQIIIMVFTFILSYMIGRLYYNCQPTDENIMENSEHHALGRTNKMYGRLYQSAHQVLFFGLFGYGVGVKIAASHLVDAERRWIDVLVPGYSLVIIVICLNIIRISHPFSSVWLTRVWVQRGIIIMVMSLVPLAAQSVNHGLLFAAMFICVIMLIVIDVEGNYMVEQAKIELKEKAENLNSSIDKDHNHNGDNANVVMDMDMQQ